MKKDDPNWKHKKGSTSESVQDLANVYIEGVLKKEVKALKKGAETLKGKDVAKADEIADEYTPSEFIQKLVESGKFSEEEIGRMIEVDRLGKSQVSASGWHRRNPEKVGTPEDPDYRVLKGSGKVTDIKDSKPAKTGPASKKPPGIYKPDKDGKMVRQPD